MARITGQGLMSIAILVILLWACALGERMIVRRANQDAGQALESMRSLRLKKRRPASAPTYSPKHSRRPALG